VQFSSACVTFPDPNDYIDDPNMQNGFLECGDTNLTQYGFEPPTYWERVPHPGSAFQDDCYASLHGSFSSEDSRWEIEEPFEGDSFVLLSTGGEGNFNGNLVQGAKISQEVFLNAGDILLGAYFYGTIDYAPFNDFSTIYLRPEGSSDPEDRLELAYCDVLTVGDYKSTHGHPYSIMGGWVPFSYTIEDANYAGSYYLECEVVDTDDMKVTSYLAVDGLQICSGTKLDSDIDHDGGVDMTDYLIFSSAWLAFCPDDITGIDPNTISDPNIPCQLSDFNNDSYVDTIDLATISNEWLLDISCEQSP
jgi:hypothetical protein